MSQTQTLLPNRDHRKAQIAERRIAAFEKRHGCAHMQMLCQAAFPLALTPDLLYRLWANFQRDTSGHFLDIPWIAVSDILLSPLCQEVGEALYELENTVRNQLIERLQADEQLGQQRIQALSEFLLEYISQQLQSEDVDIRDFAQAQRWTALAYTQPEKVAQDLAATFQRLGADTVAGAAQPDKPELVRMASLVETLASPLIAAKLEPLLIYARGMEQWAKGNLQQATAQLEQIADAGKIQISGVDLPIPEGTDLDLAPSDPDVQNRNFKAAAQDFSGKKLRGRSFQGQMLAGANFSKADLRGANFTDATLTGANFSEAKMGLQRRWVLALILPTFMLSIISGLMAALVGLGGWGPFFGAFMAPSMDAEAIFILVGCLAGFLLFPWLCFVTVKSKLTASLSAAALSFIGALLFALGILLPIVGMWDQAIVWRVFTAISAGITLVLAIALARLISHQAIGKTTVRTAILVILAFVIAFFLGQGFALMTSLSLMTTLLALWLIWLSHRCHKLSSTLLVAILISLIPGAITAALIIMSAINSASDIWAAALVGVIVALIMIILVIPFTFAGTISPSGATAGTLLSLSAIILSTFISKVAFLAVGSDSNWALIVVMSIISAAVAALGWATAISIAVCLAIIWAESNSKALTLTVTLIGATQLILSAVVFIFFAVGWTNAFAIGSGLFVLSIAIGIIFASMVVGLGVYIFWQAIGRNDQFVAVLDLAIAFTAKGSTTFRNADLTSTNFTAATLKNVNFSNAILTNVRWFHAQKLNTAHFSQDSCLRAAKAQWLVTSGLGNRQTFDDLNLQNINLQHINLSDTSFIRTDLSGANLQETNLSRAKLINTNLDQADLFGAALTGAYVSDLTITEKTKMRGIDCQYIFTQLPTPENPDPARLPTDRRKIFKPGEFAQLMRQKYLVFSETLTQEAEEL